MNRLQKKCMIASAGFHLLLALLLLVGPGFLAPTSTMPDAPLLTFIPYKTTDDDRQGGGSRNGGSPPPAPVTPPEPAAPTPPTPVKRDEPKPEPVKPKPEPKETPEQKDDSFSNEITTKPKPKPKLKVSTDLVKRDTSDLNAKAKEAAEARAAAQARADAINRFSRSIDRIGGDLSGSTSIELKGPVGGGIPYANFLQGVKKIYTDAWLVPDGIKDDSATVAVTVTIARDGSVISSHIIRRSGDAAVDQSVQMTLDRVSKVCPLPDDSKDNQRTVTINFNVRAKLLG